MNKKNIKGLQLILALQQVQELIDELKGTNYYRQEIKQTANNLERLMNPLLLKELTNIYNLSPEMTINVLRHQEELIKRVASSLEPHTLCAYNQGLTELLNTPEEQLPNVEMVKLSA